MDWDLPTWAQKPQDENTPKRSPGLSPPLKRTFAEAHASSTLPPVVDSNGKVAQSVSLTWLERPPRSASLLSIARQSSTVPRSQRGSRSPALSDIARPSLSLGNLGRPSRESLARSGSASASQDSEHPPKRQLLSRSGSQSTLVSREVSIPAPTKSESQIEERTAPAPEPIIIDNNSQNSLDEDHDDTERNIVTPSQRESSEAWAGKSTTTKACGQNGLASREVFTQNSVEQNRAHEQARKEEAQRERKHEIGQEAEHVSQRSLEVNAGRDARKASQQRAADKGHGSPEPNCEEIKGQRQEESESDTEVLDDTEGRQTPKSVHQRGISNGSKGQLLLHKSLADQRWQSGAKANKTVESWLVQQANRHIRGANEASAKDVHPSDVHEGIEADLQKNADKIHRPTGEVYGPSQEDVLLVAEEADQTVKKWVRRDAERRAQLQPRLVATRPRPRHQAEPRKEAPEEDDVDEQWIQNQVPQLTGDELRQRKEEDALFQAKLKGYQQSARERAQKQADEDAEGARMQAEKDSEAARLQAIANAEARRVASIERAKRRAEAAIERREAEAEARQQAQVNAHSHDQAYNKDYLAMFNDYLQGIVQAYDGPGGANESQLEDSYLGGTLWTAVDKEVFFPATSQCGHDICRIATAVGKSVTEVALYRAELEQGLERQLMFGAEFDIGEIDAAQDVSIEHVQDLEAVADALAWEQWKRDIEKEVQKHGERWLVVDDDKDDEKARQHERQRALEESTSSGSDYEDGPNQTSATAPGQETRTLSGREADNEQYDAKNPEGLAKWRCSECNLAGVRCSREQPACERCRKRGTADRCLYLEHIPGIVNTTSGHTAILKHERRVRAVERYKDAMTRACFQCYRSDKVCTLEQPTCSNCTGNESEEACTYSPETRPPPRALIRASQKLVDGDRDSRAASQGGGYGRKGAYQQWFQRMVEHATEHPSLTQDETTLYIPFATMTKQQLRARCATKGIITPRGVPRNAESYAKRLVQAGDRGPEHDVDATSQQGTSRTEQSKRAQLWFSRSSEGDKARLRPWANMKTAELVARCSMLGVSVPRGTATTTLSYAERLLEAGDEGPEHDQREEDSANADVVEKRPEGKNVVVSASQGPNSGLLDLSLIDPNLEAAISDAPIAHMYEPVAKPWGTSGTEPSTGQPMSSMVPETQRATDQVPTQVQANKEPETEVQMNEYGKPQSSQKRLLRTRALLHLSQHLFMNSSNPDYDFRTHNVTFPIPRTISGKPTHVSTQLLEPAMFRSALDDLTDHIKDITRSLVEVVYQQTCSRMRREDDVEKDAPEFPVVRERDVHHAAEMLKMPTSMDAYWAGFLGRHDVQWTLEVPDPDNEGEMQEIAVDREMVRSWVKEGGKDLKVLSNALSMRHAAETQPLGIEASDRGNNDDDGQQSDVDQFADEALSIQQNNDMGDSGQGELVHTERLERLDKQTSKKELRRLLRVLGRKIEDSSSSSASSSASSSDDGEAVDGASAARPEQQAQLSKAPRRSPSVVDYKPKVASSEDGPEHSESEDEKMRGNSTSEDDTGKPRRQNRVNGRSESVVDYAPNLSDSEDESSGQDRVDSEESSDAE